MQLTLRLAALLTLCLGASPAFAEQTAKEKAKVVKNDAVRAAKKTAHRVEEGVICAKSDADCLAKKAKDRTVEAADAVVDKASEIKDEVN